MKFFSVSLLSVLVFLVACSPGEKYLADFNLLDTAKSVETYQLEAKNAQELVTKKSHNIVEKGLVYKIQNGEMLLDIERGNSSIKINASGLGLPASWKEFQDLQVLFENKSKEDIKTAIVLWAPRGRLPDTVLLPGNSSLVKSIDLHDLPLIGSPTEKYLVNEIEFQFTSNIDTRVQINSIALFQKSAARDFVVVDEFGQRKSTTWLGKVAGKAEFEAHLEKEIRDLQQQFNSPFYDRYLGRRDMGSYPTNGYFSLASRPIGGEERWFFK